MLNKNNTDRSYLFGRLLAIHVYTALRADPDDSRVLRLRDKYVAHPRTTFVKIETEVMPDMYPKLSDTLYGKVMDAKADIIAALESNGYNDDPLTEAYLPGYKRQRTAIKA